METKTVVLKGAGSFIIAEAVISIAVSEDQRVISNVGRILRIGIGIGLLVL